MQVEMLEPRRLLTVVFTVSTTADSGAGSLRAAITNADNVGLPYSTEILFAIPGKGVRTIKPLSALPTITVQVDMEGATDSAGDPLIELDGESAGSSDVNGLTFDRSTPSNVKPSVVSGLIVNRFSGIGISIGGTAPTDVYGCRIGTDSTGKKALGNNSGVLITGSNNQIGLAGSGPAFQTLISGNTAGGVGIGGDNNIVQNCFIGVDVSGNNDLGNSTFGIEIGGSYNLIGGARSGQGNVVCGTTADLGGGAGIQIFNGGQFNEILGNNIGASADGTVQIGNGLGVDMDSGSNNFIGDGRAADGNLITGNRGPGIDLLDGSNNNDILANIIGFDVKSHIINGNNDAGVEIEDSSNNIINGNTINANNGDGVLITGAASGNSLSDDLIGVDTSGEKLGALLGNNGNGVNIEGASQTSITDTDIENNKLAGLEIDGSTATLNSFVRGEIFNNSKLGISVGDNTGTDHPNRAANANGSGLPNEGINHPVLSSAVVTGNQTVITGSFVGLDGHNYNVLFYASSKADHSGFGQGQTYLTETSFVTLADGTSDFMATYPHHLAAGQVITAVADIVGNVAGNADVSEFSNAVPVSGALISGSVFNDANGNGKQDSHEKSLAKQTVFIDSNGNGVFDSASEVSARTDSSGNFTLFGPPTGTVHLMLQTASGYSQTVPKPSQPYYKLKVTPLAQISGKIFGERKITAAAIMIPADVFSQADTDRKTNILAELMGLL